MSWVLLAAMYFVLWWIVLFVTLPLGMRTHEEEGEVTLGTEASAPRAPRLLFKAFLTTVITTAIVGACFVAVDVYGWSFEDIPSIIPPLD